MLMIRSYFKMIKFSHTLFALPFALSSAVLAWQQVPVSFKDIFLILIAMASARSAAMGFNRITDVTFDAKNPRTSNREIPAGNIPLISAIFFVIFFSGVFIVASAMLGKLCLYLSIPVLLILLSYSYTKRFTWLSHIYLGFAISLAPVGAWIAITGTFSWSIVLLSMALMTYIAGFDILYACQDMEFDKNEGLFSIPVRFGIKKALILSAMIHVLSFVFFFLIHVVFDTHLTYLITICVIGFLLVIEHRLIKPNDLANLNVAFFHVNSLISITLFIGILSDELIRRLL